MERFARYLAAQPRIPNLATIEREYPALNRERIRASLANANFMRRVEGLKAGPSRTLNSRTEEELRRMARNKGLAVNANMNKNEIIQAMTRQDPYNYITKRKLPGLLKGKLKTHGYATRNAISNFLGGRNIAGMKRKNIFPILKNLNSRPPPVVNKENLKNVKSRELINTNITYRNLSKRMNLPSFNLRNTNLNMTINQLANLAVAGRPKVNARSWEQRLDAMRALRASIEHQKAVALRHVLFVRMNNPDAMPTWQYAPYDYQQQLADAMLNPEVPGVLAIHSIGSGKTFTAVLAAETLFAANLITHVIVITPKTLIHTFKKELQTHGIKQLGRYHIFGTDEFLGHVEKKTDFKIKSALVIIDEIHNLRTKPALTKINPKTGERHLTKSELIMHAVKFAPKIIGLTATPIVNNVSEIKMPLAIVMKKEYSYMRPFQLSQMTQFAPYMSFFERGLDDVRFPSYSIDHVVLTMTDTYRTRWRNAIAAQPDYFEINKRRQLAKAVNDDALDDNIKVEWTIKKVRDIIAKKGKVIVYSEFIEAGANLIQTRLEGIYGKDFVARIDGEIKDTKRAQAQTDYNSGAKPVMIITRAGGEGIDLKMTNAVIILEPPWNPAGIYQIIGRGVRVNSHKEYREATGRRGHVNAYLVCSKPETEVKIGDKVIPSDIDLYNKIVWPKENEIMKFYESMTPHSIGTKLTLPQFPQQSRKNYNATMTKLHMLYTSSNKMSKVADIINTVRPIYGANPVFTATAAAPSESKLTTLLNGAIKLYSRQ